MPIFNQPQFTGNPEGLSLTPPLQNPKQIVQPPVTEPPATLGNPADRQYWLTELQKPVTAQIGLSEPERQDIYNLARRQQTGAEGSALETLLSTGAGRGFRAGESGFMDTAVGRLLGGGAERLGSFANQQAIEEAKNRFAQNMELNTANQNRLLGGGGLAKEYEALDVQKQAAASAAAGAGNQLAWEKEKWAQEFPWEQEQARMNQLFGLMGMMGGSQQDIYAPYFQGMLGAG